MHAVEKYNPASENKFCTYAAWWIKQYMVRAIQNQSQAIRIPVHMTEDIEKIKIASRDLYVVLGRLPTEEELSEKTNINVDRVKEAMSYIIDMTSLDKTVNEEEDTSIGDLIEDTKFINPESLCMNQASRDLIIAVIDTLEERESKIIKLRYGLLEDGISYSLEDIGKKLNLSKERVRQLEKRASRKLRNPIRLKVLKEYL